MKKLLLAALITCSMPAIAEEEPNFYMEGIRQYQDWTVVARVDSFSDERQVVAAQHTVGNHGSINIMCHAGERIIINAQVDNSLIDTIGGMMNFDPITVKYKVDGTIYTSKGKYPNQLIAKGVDTAEFIAVAKAGNSMKIRTDHGQEQHTWDISLRGFTYAMDRTIAECKKLK